MQHFGTTIMCLEYGGVLISRVQISEVPLPYTANHYVYRVYIQEHAHDDDDVPESNEHSEVSQVV